LRGNLQAIDKNVRFIERDLNRTWSPEYVQEIVSGGSNQLNAEDLELSQIHKIIMAEIEDYKPESLVFLDLHTTTATGGIFTIPYEDENSIKTAKDLFAPVILGLLEGINGTIMHYFNQSTFPDIPTISLCFESGQHNDPLSVNRAIAAITNCMRSIGSVRQQDVAHRHNYMLQTYSEGLPALTHLLDKHSIKNNDGFVMKPGFENFQAVHKGQILATDNQGEILCPEDCLILMPLYQKQGEDGFFLVKEGF